MNELREALYSISDSYYDFVYGIMEFASRNTERTKIILDYITNNPNALSADVVRFVTFEMDLMEDPDTTTNNLIAVGS